MERQDALCAALEQAAALCRAYGLPDGTLAEDARQMADYRVPVAVLGAFNTGKSALVNRLLGTQLMQVSLTEETAAPAEVFWGRQGVQLLREGRWIPADAAALRAGGPGLADIQMARAGLPLPALEGLEGLSVADTPGIGTPQAARGGALLALARRAGAYILVFGADAPVVTESLAAFLSCLPLDSRPVLCVLTKCDQFPQEDVRQIAAYLEESLARQLGLHAQLHPAPGDEADSAMRDFLRELQVRAGALRRAEGRRRLAAGSAPLAQYLTQRIQNSRLLEPELARKAQLLDRRLETLDKAVDAMNRRARQLLEDAAGQAARHSRETLAPLAGPLAEMLAAGQDPCPCADGAVLGVLRAEARSRLLPILDAYEKGMHRLAGLYGLPLPAAAGDPLADTVDGVFSGTAAAFSGAGRDAQSLSAALQELTGRCLSQGGLQAFERLCQALTQPLYGQLASLHKALEDTRLQQQARAEATRQSLDALQRDLGLLRELTGEEAQTDAV